MRKNNLTDVKNNNITIIKKQTTVCYLAL